MAVLFLQNSNHARFSSMLLEFRKAYANNDNKYPKDLGSMMDVMRQQPEIKPKKPKPTRDGDPAKDVNKTDDLTKDVNKTDDGASSFAQADDKKGKCYCCGDEKCRSNVCKKK